MPLIFIKEGNKMSDKSNFFAMLSRMKYVNRWGLMRNTSNETIAEHTMDVIFISHALVVIANTYFDGALDEGRAVLLAAYHDAPEIMTGDMPTPVKYFDSGIRKAYARVENAVQKKMISSLPEEMQLEYDGLFNIEDDEDILLYRYVKAADKLSAFIKCVEEEKTGNSDFKDAKEATLKTLLDLKMPEVDFFMKNFLPGYYLTLDEQTAGIAPKLSDFEKLEGRLEEDNEDDIIIKK